MYAMYQNVCTKGLRTQLVKSVFFLELESIQSPMSLHLTIGIGANVVVTAASVDIGTGGGGGGPHFPNGCPALCKIKLIN